MRILISPGSMDTGAYRPSTKLSLQFVVLAWQMTPFHLSLQGSPDVGFQLVRCVALSKVDAQA